MELEKYKNRKWEDLTDKEKEEWNNFAHKEKGMLKVMNILVAIDNSKKCYMCKHKFPNGILNRFPYQVVSLSKMIKGEFLFHLESTHGIPLEIFFTQLNSFSNQ